VRVVPEQAALFTRMVSGALLDPLEPLPAGPDGWPRYELLYPTRGAARGSLLAMGPWIEVLAPRELREELRAAAEAVVALYETLSGEDAGAASVRSGAAD
jgi:predicted DNA-binding transcriptional regulator YafY